MGSDRNGEDGRQQSTKTKHAMQTRNGFFSTEQLTIEGLMVKRNVETVEADPQQHVHEYKYPQSVNVWHEGNRAI